jgi:outer membrane biosynthesis protein TonB
MLRMALLGLLILFSVGVLSAMELSAPPRRVVATVQPLAERSANISASYDASAKADRLEVAAASSAMPTEAASVENPGAPQDIHVRSPAPEPIVRHRPDPKTIAAAKPPKPKPKPKPIVVKRTANVQRAKAASETEPCRLKAFGGLLKALNLTRCEI